MVIGNGKQAHLPQLAANIDIVAHPSALSLAAPLADCKSFNGNKHCHRWDFRLAENFPLAPIGDHTKSGLFMYIINHKLLLRLKVNDFVYFLGLLRVPWSAYAHKSALPGTRALRPTACSRQFPESPGVFREPFWI